MFVQIYIESTNARFSDVTDVFRVADVGYDMQVNYTTYPAKIEFTGVTVGGEKLTHRQLEVFVEQLNLAVVEMGYEKPSAAMFRIRPCSDLTVAMIDYLVSDSISSLPDTFPR